MNRTMRTFKILMLTLLVCALGAYDMHAQKISASPTRLNFKVSPGATGRALITVSNNAQEKHAFQVDFGDFDATRAGKSKFLEKGQVERSCANWINATPSFFELESGQTQEIELVMNVPTDSSALQARWAVAYIRIAEERRGQTTLQDGLNVNLNQSYRFGVYIFQTPPNATFSMGEVIDFNYKEENLIMRLRNIGETFLKCNTYAELTSLTTGDVMRLKAESFTVLPASNRDVSFPIPKEIPPGRYSVLGVLDYGNRDEVAAAEIEIEIPQRGNQ